jgi:hypothetical protein
VQGRHANQTPDALGAAASQLGPEAVSLATALNKQLGLAWGKTAAVLQQGFGLARTQGILMSFLRTCHQRAREALPLLTQLLRCPRPEVVDFSGTHSCVLAHRDFVVEGI